MSDDNIEKIQEGVNDEVVFYSLEDVADLLKVSLQTIKRYYRRKENPLPVFALSTQEIRVRKSDLLEWIQSLTDPRQDV